MRGNASLRSGDNGSSVCLVRNGCLLIVLLAAALPVFAETGTHAAGSEDIEEVVVTASPPERGKPPTLEFLTEVYDNRRTGSQLYRRGEHAESFPHLLAAARRGFKMAQARVSFLYQQGLGTPRDAMAAVAFLGVAAKPPTLPEISMRFNEVWDRVPVALKPGLEQLIDEYDARYGARVNRVSCDLSHSAGTFFRKLTCRFTDECSLYGRMGLTPELRTCPGYVFERLSDN